MELPPDAVWVLGEGKRPENAVKVSLHGGTIRVRLWIEAQEAVLEVEDEGIGIPAEALPRVFEPFYPGLRT